MNSVTVWAGTDGLTTMTLGSRLIAATARPMLDDEWPAEPFIQPLADDTSENALRATCSKSHHDAHGPRRIGLRLCRAQDGRHGGSPRGQTQKFAAGTFHCAFPEQCRSARLAVLCSHRELQPLQARMTFLPTMRWSCIAIQSGATSTIVCVIWMSVHAGMRQCSHVNRSAAVAAASGAPAPARAGRTRGLGRNDGSMRPARR